MVESNDPRLGYALKQAQRALHRRMEDALRPLGMNSAQYALMVALRATPEQTNADLAEAAFLTPQSMQGVLAKLEMAGLVERRQDRHHGRRQLARLTESGRELVAQADDCIEPIEAKLWDAAQPLSPEVALALLNRLRTAVRGKNTK